MDLRTTVFRTRIPGATPLGTRVGDVAFIRVEYDWQTWVGRTQTVADWIAPSRVAAWLATLDHEAKPVNEGDAVPPGFHWTLAPHVARESELGPDGHAQRDYRSFLPPVPLPRRLWAGSRVTFHQPLRVGDRVERASVIASVEEKQGRESPLVFVTVRHRYTVSGDVAIEEEQDLVYREPPAAGTAAASPRASAAEIAPAWQRTIHPTETLLFRYSALTLNTHRIHYDRRYAIEAEGYAGLVVHGPLIATLLLDLIQSRAPETTIARFSFKALRPTFDTGDFAVCGAPVEGAGHYRLWSTDNRGERAVEAEAWT
jgi:3-methylfumaryl-CoA hydratase